MCFVCFLTKQHTVFEWKDAISGFPVSQGSAEALDRWGEKTKHRLISYFLSNTSAKNYRNRIVYVKIIASRMWDVFWDTVYISLRLTPPSLIAILVSSSMNSAPSQTKFHLCPNHTIIIFANSAVFALTLIAQQPAPLPSPLSTANLLLHSL